MTRCKPSKTSFASTRDLPISKSIAVATGTLEQADRSMIAPDGSKYGKERGRNPWTKN